MKGDRFPTLVSKALAVVTIVLVVLTLVVIATQRAQAQTFKVLYSFKARPDGVGPNSGLLRYVNGQLYGTTGSGGAHGKGTVYRLVHYKSGWKENVVYSFADKPDGAGPSSGLVRDPAGNVYGTTGGGGAYGFGTVFKLDKSGKETVLYSFTGGADGSLPGAAIRDASGNLYGTTVFGGSSNCGGGCGVVFEVDTTGQETTLYSFQGGTDGVWPDGGVVQDAAGNLYGTTSWGGPAAYGTVFKLDTTGQETILHGFSDSPDGRYPWAGVIEDASGNFYGTTVIGGGSWCIEEGSHCGIVFKVDSAGDETILYSFTGGSDGGDAYAGLVQDANGNLYGTTTFAGSGKGCYSNDGCGTIFKLDTSGMLTVLHSFTGKDGCGSAAGLIINAAGILYGTAPCGGAHGKGVVFEIMP